MRAITLLQPWASFVSLGWKRVETRSWATTHRGTLAIHASSSGRAVVLVAVVVATFFTRRRR